MRRVITFVAVLCLVNVAIAQEPAEKKAATPEATKADAVEKEAVEILRKVDAAAKAVRLVRYDFTGKATGSLAARRPSVKGTAILAGNSPRSPEKYRVEITTQQPGSDDTRKYTAGTDGDLWFLIDWQTKKAHEDIDPAVLGMASRLIRAGMMIEFVHPNPFNDEINGESVALKGTKKIGDEECFVVQVKYATATNQVATWYVSKKDFLPRRVDRSFSNPTGETGGTEMVVTGLVVEPKFDKDPFKLVVPEGFEKTDDFAPDRLPMIPVQGG